jgi:hypothetical protein
MKRRRLVALVSAAVFLMLGILAVATVLFVTRSDTGRGKLRQVVQGLVTRNVTGG